MENTNMASREEQQNQRRIQKLARQARKTETGGKVPKMSTTTAPRDIKEGSKRKEFTVAPCCSFTDEDGIKRYGGEKVQLSQKMAKYLNEKGFIAHEIEDFDDDDATDSRSETKTTKSSSDDDTSGASTEASGDKEKSSTKSAPDSDGKGGSSGGSKTNADETSGGNDSKPAGTRKL